VSGVDICNHKARASGAHWIGECLCSRLCWWKLRKSNVSYPFPRWSIPYHCLYTNWAILFLYVASCCATLTIYIWQISLYLQTQPCVFISEYSWEKVSEEYSEIKTQGCVWMYRLICHIYIVNWAMYHISRTLPCIKICSVRNTGPALAYRTETVCPPLTSSSHWVPLSERKWCRHLYKYCRVR
jgi:hypothetical protein